MRSGARSRRCSCRVHPDLVGCAGSCWTREGNSPAAALPIQPQSVMVGYQSGTHGAPGLMPFGHLCEGAQEWCVSPEHQARDGSSATAVPDVPGGEILLHPACSPPHGEAM